MRERIVATSAGCAARMDEGMTPLSEPPRVWPACLRPAGRLCYSTRPAWVLHILLSPRRPMLRRIFFRWIVCAATTLVFAALTGRAETKPELVVLQLPYTHQFQFAGVYAAISQGYFRERNLD